MLSLTLRSVRGAINHISTRSLSPSYTPLALSPSQDSSTSSPTASFNGEADFDSLPAQGTARSTAYNRLLAFLFFLLPSFIQSRIRPGAFKPRRMHPTSWLDGLRGVASLIVFFFHFTDDTHKGLLMSYGVQRDGDNAASSPLQLPFLRVIFAGKPMVHIFFVISGFVLAYKPLRRIRARQFDSLQKTLASSVFRRGFRLFLPTLVSTFIIMFLRYYGWIPRKAKDSLYEQFDQWQHEVIKILGFIWQWDSSRTPDYDSHLWTIPIEMSFSMFLFVVITGLSHVKTYVRLAAVVGLGAFCLRHGHYAGWEFMAGVVLAEVQLIQDAHKERKAALEHDKEAAYIESSVGTSGLSDSTAGGSRRRSVAKLVFQGFLIVNLIFALYVAGWPREKWEETPAIDFLLQHTPEPYRSRGQSWPIFVWYAIGAVQIVLALQQIEPLRRVFNTKPAQYLADVSYSLYICHGPVMKVLHHRMMPYLWEPVGGLQGADMGGRFLVWFFGLILMAIPVFWVSDIFLRVVDNKCVEFARWIEKMCVIDE
ncbi:hypothetical protein D7B24_009496 [Verticillium nonalfalfae]|uniref:Acyltransferase 3 domain-containing protein n=1 Tax=Verticillium nonalfalfae TaxID=1051616 RepID=A0A3M9Y2S3_9PEZI|nr:uncharacterized protein D7B24_009496 [Verticillium nonalfalfae]RNJ54737.1 hypothetical protein D7B24_009496 [Verticillium nonalfalfae]